MKACFLLIASSLMLASGGVGACGTRLPSVQARINAEESEQLRRLVRDTAHDAEVVFIGTVTELERPSYSNTKLGSATLSVDETLKGTTSIVRTVHWRDKGAISCKESAMFLNVGFRPGGKYIVYIRGGNVTRAAAADHLRSGSLTLDQEREIVSRVGST